MTDVCKKEYQEVSQADKVTSSDHQDEKETNNRPETKNHFLRKKRSLSLPKEDSQKKRSKVPQNSEDDSETPTKKEKPRAQNAQIVSEIQGETPYKPKKLLANASEVFRHFKLALSFLEQKLANVLNQNARHILAMRRTIPTKEEVFSHNCTFFNDMSLTLDYLVPVFYPELKDFRSSKHLGSNETIERLLSVQLDTTKLPNGLTKLFKKTKIETLYMIDWPVVEEIFEWAKKTTSDENISKKKRKLITRKLTRKFRDLYAEKERELVALVQSQSHSNFIKKPKSDLQILLEKVVSVDPMAQKITLDQLSNPLNPKLILVLTAGRVFYNELART